MFALRIDLLTGRYVATAYFDRSEPEWPIHPARVFSALVAAHHGSGADRQERRALEWLEAQPSPSIACSSAARRDVVPVFVPVNDPSVVGDLEDRRLRLSAAERDIDEERLRASSANGKDRARADRELARAQRILEKERVHFERHVAAAVAPGEVSMAAVKTAAEILPEGRRRQRRTFPSVTPDDPVVHLVWHSSEPSQEVRAALQRLAGSVTRIGHSSSLVAMRVVESPPLNTWVPAEAGRITLRVVTAGQVERLEEEFVRHREELPRNLPSRLQAYRASSSEATRVACGFWGDDWIVFRRVSGAAFPGRRTADLARALRDALMAHAAQPVPEVLSGHLPNGEPSKTPHAAYLALPFVEHEHADGIVLGLALAVPRDATDLERSHVLRAIGRWERERGRRSERPGEPPTVPLFLGRAGDCRLQRVVGAVSQWNLNPDAWCKASKIWTTATPIALDRNPGELGAADSRRADAARQEAARLISAACEHAGLPRPASVCVSTTAFLSGVEVAQLYGPFPRRLDRFRRVLVHADILFDSDVRGPVLLGAGRYAGLGLLRPIPGKTS